MQIANNSLDTNVGASEISTRDRDRTILEILREHPFLSREQLQMILGWRKRTLQWHLEKLRGFNLVRMVNGRLPEIRTRSLWVLTREGLERLAGDHISLESYLEKHCYHRSRLERLVLVLDRVYLVRSFLLQLKNAKWNWCVADWDVEVELPFCNSGYDVSAPVHGIARLKNANGQWLTLAIEYDTGKAPVKSAKPRLARFVEGMQDEQFWGETETKFPVWVIVAANRERLNDYRTLLVQLISITSDLPRSFLATQDKLSQVYQNPSASVWETELDDANVPLLDGIQGDMTPVSEYLPWNRLPHPKSFSDKSIELTPLSVNEPIKRSQRQLAALSLALYSLDKELLSLVGSHPLLSASEMACIKQIPARSIRRSLERLVRRELIEEHSARERVQKSIRKHPRAEKQITKAHCYVLSEKGLWIMAAWAGFGLAVEEYAKARGWKRRFGELVYHWEHTRIENEIFLQVFREARKRGHLLRFWLSELESRLYFDYEQQSSTMPFRSHRNKSDKRQDGTWADSFGEWAQSIGVANREAFNSALAHRSQMFRRFLPDGRGLYATEDEEYSIAVEVDRSKTNRQKMRSKFLYYEHAMFGDDPDRWRILIVTTGWKRALNIARLVVQYTLSGFSFREFKHLRGAKLMAALKEADRFDSFIRGMFPVYVTTVDAIRKKGVASRIWIDARSAIAEEATEMTYFLECFVPREDLSQ